MDLNSVKNFCNSLPHCIEKELGEPGNLLSFQIHEKKFAYFKTSSPERWRFSFRTTPERFIELTDQPGIKPARYMHRFHWVTIVNVKMMDDAYLKELIQWSYNKAVSSLSKKLQNQLNSSV